jgi:predicted MPP superfamily phosphohydrolase
LSHQGVPSGRDVVSQGRSLVPVLFFVAVILTITALAWLMVGSFVHPLIRGGWRALGLAWLISVAPLFVLLRNLFTGGYPSAFVRLWMFRVFWYSQLLALALALASFLGFVAGLPFGEGALFGRWVILALAPLLVIAGVVGYFGTRQLVVRTLDARFKDLPAALDGLRIVQLSDLHVGPHTPKRHLERVAAAVTSAEPHIIAHTGDQVDDYPRDMEVFAAAFGHLRAPLGTFAIPGNHDVYAGWSAVRAGLETMGATVLVNSAVRLRHNGAEFYLGGTGDPAGSQFRRGAESGAPDLARLLAAIPTGMFSIVLAHNPALWPPLAARGISLTLSGHTHYGQLATKNWSLASVFLELAMGGHERNGALLYINPGTNYWGIPFRIGAPPEVTVLTLRTSDASQLVPSRSS